MDFTTTTLMPFSGVTVRVQLIGPPGLVGGRSVAGTKGPPLMETRTERTSVLSLAVPFKTTVPPTGPVVVLAGGGVAVAAGAEGLGFGSASRVKRPLLGS